LGRLRFGPAGKPTNFSGDYEEVPPLLRQMGLDALEYEAVRGVRVTKEKAERIREAAQQNLSHAKERNSIFLSHAKGGQIN